MKTHFRESFHSGLRSHSDLHLACWESLKIRVNRYLRKCHHRVMKAGLMPSLRWTHQAVQRMLPSSYLGWETPMIHQLVQTKILRPEREIVHQNQMTLAHFLSLEDWLVQEILLRLEKETVH